MKLLNIIITILILAGCGQVNQKENLDVSEEQHQNSESVIHLEKQQENSKFPDWLTQLYPTELKLDYQTIGQELISFQIINDSVTYCIYKQMDGACERNLVVSFVDRMQKEELEIGNNCDHDLSRPSHSWKNFELKSSNIILTTQFTESVHDSLIDEDGWMKKEYDFLEAKTTVDTGIQVFQINQQGLIIEIDK